MSINPTTFLVWASRSYIPRAHQISYDAKQPSKSMISDGCLLTRYSQISEFGQEGLYVLFNPGMYVGGVGGMKYLSENVFVQLHITL